MTSNRTNEQIVAEALSVNWRNLSTNESLGRQRMLATHVIAALRDADRLVGEPTEAQIEAAAKAYRKHGKGSKYVGIVCRECDEYFEDRAEFDAHRMRAALVAALAVLYSGSLRESDGSVTGVKSKYISPHLPDMIRNLWKGDPSEKSVRTALDLAGDLIQELIDLKATPMLPSSTVDEEELAEVLARVYDEASMDSPSDYPLQYTEAMQYGREAVTQLRNRRV